MKYYFFLIGIFLLPITSGAQTKKDYVNHSKERSKMKSFNRSEFNRHKKNGRHVFKLEDSSTVTQIESTDIFAENVMMPNKLTEHRKTFYKTGQLKAEGTYFYGFPVGVGKQYDERGNVVKTIDWDRPFKFSIDDLSEKMKKLGIDIQQPGTGIRVHRTQNPKPTYQVSCPVDGSLYVTKVFVVDGITGEILDESVHKAR